MSFRYQIDRAGNFDPSAEQDLNQGTSVEFVLVDASWSLVYVFSGSPLTPDRNLFGATPVRVADGGTIKTSAVINTVYTLSVSETGVGDDRTGIKNGTIKVGGG
jgi:hypothetical protein